jgi:ribosomal protein S7
VDAVINAGPREDSTRVGSAGVVRRQAVDLSPFRYINNTILVYYEAIVYYCLLRAHVQ